MNFISGGIKIILEKYAEPLLKKTAKITLEEWEKFKIDFDIVFLKYLKNSYEKYSKIKTILYRTEPKYIYNFFECPTLVKDNIFEIKGDDINNLLDLSNFLIIQGTGGMGKSTLMKHLFINEISHKDLIPVFIELKDINDIKDDYDICDFIFDNLTNLGSSLNKNYLEYALKSGCFLFLLDGYDEITTEKGSSFFKKFNSFCDKYPTNKYIISSRPYSESEFIEFQRFTILEICSFNKKQVLSLINKIDFDIDIKKRFLKAVEEKLYDMHESFVSNPLLLNIMLLTYDNYAEVPQKLHLFYANAFETLYSKHDATKSGYRRELKSKLPYDLFKKVFSYFCFSTYFQGKIEFSYDDLNILLKKVPIKNTSFKTKDFIDDLVNSVCVLYKDGLNYKFAHRSFQEYFTAVFLKELPDKNMKQMAIQLIKKDTNRTINDNVFNMLYDMTEERVEHNILLPLLEEVEATCKDEDKYKFYFRKMNLAIGYNKHPQENEMKLWRLTKRGDELVEFLFEFTKYYTNRDEIMKKKLQNSADKLLDFIVENRNYMLNEKIYGRECIRDIPVYSLIKETWIGDRINTLANLSTILHDKQKESELDLTGLLLE